MEARTFNANALVINERFAALGTRRPVTQGLPDTDWQDNQFGLIQIWTTTVLDQAQILLIGAELVTSITTGVISTQTAIKGLQLALSLRTMTPGNLQVIFRQQERGLQATEELLASAPLPTLNEFSSTPYPLRAQQEAAGPIQQLDAVPGTEVPQNEEEDMIRVVADSDNIKCLSFCFISAFLMKLLVKSSDNVHKGLTNMKARFTAFYGLSRTIDAFRANLQQLSTYKDALLSQSLILVTYTHAVANTHQNFSQTMTRKEQGVLSYLGTLPFSYTGMRSYTLLIDLSRFTGTALPKLITMFYCNVTAASLIKITQIFNTYEKTTENPNKSVLFRYCTLWAPNYFSSVRSKNSAHLLLTAAYAWKVLNKGNEYSDPEKIAAAGKLSEEMKKTLRIAGTLIGNTLKASML